MNELLFLVLVCLGAAILWALFSGEITPPAPKIIDEDEVRAQEFTLYWLRIKELFPYLPTPRVKDTTSEAILEGMVDIIGSQTEVGYVRALNFLPAPAPPLRERKRHMVVFGKTGSGKSTFLERLIYNDLYDGFGVAVISPEGELFRDRLLNLVPDERHGDLIYFAPAHPDNAITFNPLSLEPGDDPVQAADDLFTILARILEDAGLGPRMKPLLQNTLAALVGCEGATLLDIKRLLEDASFRAEVIASADSYVREFFETTFPRYAKDAAVPILNRLDRFLRTPKFRRTLCNPNPGLSIRRALRENRILFFDLFGLNEEQLMILGQLLLSKFQLELLRRETAGERGKPYFVYCDEFQSFAGMSVGLWRSLLSRGRKYGLALTLANQFPGQLPAGVRDEIFGNVNSLISFILGSSDAAVVRKELLQEEIRKDAVTLEPVPVADLLDLKVGEAVAKFGGGRAFVLDTFPPFNIPEEQADALMRASWARYGSPDTQREERTQKRELKRGPDVEPLQEEPQKPQTDTAIRQRAPERRASQAPGRGGQEHTYLQELIKRAGEDRGFKATIEREVVGGGRVDVALEQEGMRIACEVAVTTSVLHELGNIRKCLAANFDRVVVVSTRKRFLGELQARIAEELGESEQKKVALTSPEECFALLDSLASEEESETIAGYKVNVSYRTPDRVEEQAKRRAVKEVVRKSLARLARRDQ